MKINWFCLGLLICLLTNGPVQAQSTGGCLEGRILDSASKPIEGVNIQVSGEALQGVRGTITDRNGWFRIAALPVGECIVRINHVAYKPVTVERITIGLGTTTSLGAIRLQAQSVAMPDVTVSGAAYSIDPTSTVNGGNLSAKTIAQLPVERNYRSVAALLPQVNTSYLGDGLNMAGATGLENKYTIDGMDVTDPFRNLTGTNLPYNFVQEVEVITGGYQAEYRSSLGGSINVITYSGGNEFHGQAFGFFANNRIAGEPRQPMIKPPIGDYSQYDAGFRLGGPILRDRLWFSIAYNPTFEREQVQIPGLAYFSDHSVIHSFAGKLTWQAGSKNNLTLTLLGDPQDRRGVGDTFGSFGTPTSLANPDPYLSDIRRGGFNVSYLGRHTLGRRLLLESYASRLSRLEKNVPATDRGSTEALFMDVSGQWSGGPPCQIDSRSTVGTLGLKATYTITRHTFKTGVEYRDNRLHHTLEGNMIQQFGEDNYFVWQNHVNGIVHNRFPAVFVQDSWQATDRLQLQAGLRWDGQYLMASTGKLGQSITNQYQPRLGIIYQPGKETPQKLYFSFGRFYQELNTWLSVGYLMIDAVTSFQYYLVDPRQASANPDHGFDSKISSRPQLKDLGGQYYDGWGLGYELQVTDKIKLGVHGVYNTLRQGLEDGMDPNTGDFWFHNPGKGALALYPKMKREYKAIELRAEKSFDGRTGFLASYVWSRTEGNYPGLFNSDYNYSFPNTNGSWDILETTINAGGLLPNDRTHVAKFSGSMGLSENLQAGAWFIWQSGTPLSELGGSEMGPPYNRFIGSRGSKGRTPPIWELNLRLAYSLGRFADLSLKPRLLLDILHIGSMRSPVNYEQIHYYSLDENGQNINPNPLYGLASRYQPPMAVRLGMEINF